MSLLALFASTALAASARTTTVLTTLEAANAGLSTADRAEKYAAMAESPFAFYRGSNVLFWMDQAGADWLDSYGSDETRSWLGGDLHVNNTGAFDDDRGEIVFGLNDFDEAVIADVQLDLLRLAVSLVLVARDVGGYSSADEADLVDALTEGWLDAMADCAGGDEEADAVFTASTTTGPLDDFLDDVQSSHSRGELLDDWTIKVSGKRVLNIDGLDDLGPVSSGVTSAISAAMSGYRASLTGGGASLSSGYFKVKSVAQRLHAGVGSLGTNRYSVLIEGASAGQGDDRILDIKAQGAPSAWSWLGAEDQADTDAASGGDHAARVVAAYKALGVHVDDHLGTMTISGGRYSVRELSPYKEGFPTEELTELDDLLSMAAQWGALLAVHQARADEDWDGGIFGWSVDDAVDEATDGDHAGFRAVIRAEALDDADQVELDYLSFLSGT